MDYIIEPNRVAYLDNYYFYQPRLIPEADSGTFTVISRWFARDRHHVYFLYNVVTGADPESFAYLGGFNCQWAKDRAFAYYFWPTRAAKQWKVLPSHSLDAFQILPGCRDSEYAHDRESIFYYGKRVPNADVHSFCIVMATDAEEGSEARSYHFSKDKEHVFFHGKTLKNVNSDRFKAVRSNGREYGTDGVNAFFNDSFRGKMVTLRYEDLPPVVQEKFKSLQ